MISIVRLLSSPRLVLGTLAFFAAYSAAAAWMPWSRSPGAPVPSWAAALGLARPFAAWPSWARANCGCGPAGGH